MFKDSRCVNEVIVVIRYGEEGRYCSVFGRRIGALLKVGCQMSESVLA
jgi:hypothetical protein